jgi:transcriptional regulator with XRE-family HTH domain
MTRTTKQTPIAVLRFVIGVKDQEFAEILGCSVHTINSLECRDRLKLSAEMARRISHETGVAISWLLAGDVSEPPVTSEGAPFTRESFERRQSLKIYDDRPHPMFFSWEFLQLAGLLRATLDGAKKREDYHLTAYRVGKFLEKLAAECGVDDKEARPKDSGEIAALILRNFIPKIKADIAEAENGPCAAVDAGGVTHVLLKAFEPEADAPAPETVTAKGKPAGPKSSKQIKKPSRRPSARSQQRV